MDKNKVLSLANKATVAVQKAVPVVLIAGMVAMLGCAFAAVDITNTLKSIVKMIYGFLYFAGLLSLIIGIVGVASAMSEEGGQDPQKLSKGKGRIVMGAIMIAAPTVLQLLGISADSISLTGG